MQTERYSLNWYQFEKSACMTFKELLSQTEFADVTLVSDDLKGIQAHKVILSSCSSKLRNVLKQTAKKEPIFYFLKIVEKFEIQGLCQSNKGDDSKGKQEEVSCAVFKESYYEIEKEKAAIEYKSNEDSSSVFESTIQTAVLLQKPNENYCDKCDYKTKSISHMRGHQRSVHNGVKFACSECELQFSYPNGLARHMKSKHL